MNHTQSATSPPAKTPSQQFIIPGRTSGLGSDSRNVSSFNASIKQTNANLSEKAVRVPKATVAPLEAEPSRPALYRHGRQRSNTVGEAISFPTVKVDTPLTSPTQQRAAAAIPEGHCHKCFERVTENGIRLQNGDRYHISCFLCNGCKQVFTESEFHIVFGRPYHPNVCASFVCLYFIKARYFCAGIQLNLTFDLIFQFSKLVRVSGWNDKYDGSGNQVPAMSQGDWQQNHPVCWSVLPPSMFHLYSLQQGPTEHQQVF
jgi:hypothetical protein